MFQSTNEVKLNLVHTVCSINVYYIMNKGLITGVPEVPVSERCTEMGGGEGGRYCSAIKCLAEAPHILFSQSAPTRFIPRVKCGAIYGWRGAWGR